MVKVFFEKTVYFFLKKLYNKIMFEITVSKFA